MVIERISLHNISASSDLRMGVSYSKLSNALFLRKYGNCSLRIRDICSVKKGTSITEADTEPGNIPVVAGGQDFAYYHNQSNRCANIITVSASGAYSGFANYWTIPIWASDCTTIQSINERKYRTKFLYHLLKLVQKELYLLQKKTDQPHVYPEDLESILIPNIDINVQDTVLQKIDIIERHIVDLSNAVYPVQETIDSVFQREFDFDYDTFEELKTHTNYSIKQSLFSNNPDLRFSVKFHRPAGDFVMKELTRRTKKKIKHFLAEPIILGASVSPKDYDESGEYYYISMATIKSWKFNPEIASLVSDSFSSEKTEKTVKKNDIIMARSGEGTIGKVALITDYDIKGIFADFTMRIRLDNKKYNPSFAYYFMRSKYFQYLVEVYKKGLGNNTNIFPIVIQEFPIIDISLEEQNRIVDEIQAEIQGQNQIVNRISELRNQVDKIIIKSID